MTALARDAAPATAEGTNPGPARHRRRHLRSLATYAIATWCGLACAPTGPVDANGLPPNVQDPTTVKTPIGALGFYRSVVALVPTTLDMVVTYIGIMTDELASLPMPPGSVGRYTSLDSREQFDPSFPPLEPYVALHKLRGQAQEARGFVRSYLSDSSAALRGHLFALEGYADVLLADLFCSGIPLSTIDYGADYTLAPGSATNEVYAAAAALFDSALTLTGDSSRLQQLAAVGRGRALLALGQYTAAAAAVTDVPTGFRYEAVLGSQSWLSLEASAFLYGAGQPGMGDREGRNGLDYRSSGDPRTSATLLDGADPLGNMLYFPAKYPLSGATSFVLADGIEARLIEAEAALNDNDDWLTILNALRTDGTFDTQPNAEDSSKTDTLWHAGTGGVAGLKPLADPGDHDGRVDVIFRERAFWLYLTAHRQGDLRRLIRRPEYLRAPDDVYPTGDYSGGTGTFGHEIVVPVPESEQQYNPNYTGCFHHNA